MRLSNAHRSPAVLKDRDNCNLLTEKQVAALELLAKHMTSKEISRALNISPHTVDQRIDSARKRLGVSTRRELAQAYLTWKQTCQRLTYEESLIDTLTDHQSIPSSDEHKLISSINDPNRLNSDLSYDHLMDYSLVPEQFDGQHGTLIRFLAIFGLAMIFLIIAMATIAIYVNLSDFLGR